MSVAIALATHNGERFLPDQLESLLRQTRPPDQVVIADDLSTDGTLDLIERFQRSAPFRVEIVAGETRLGPFGNFRRAANVCKADLIAFCDQDDIWLPEKLELCECVSQSTGAAAVIHSIGQFRLTPNGRRLDEVITEVPSVTVDGLRIGPHLAWAGMSMVVRRAALDLAERLKQLWDPRFDTIVKARPVSHLDHWSHAHDLYALMAARLSGSIAFVGHVLARHRLHAVNYSGERSEGTERPRLYQGPTTWSEGYLVLSQASADIAAFIRETPCEQFIHPVRQAAVSQHYARWSALWRSRSTLHGTDVAPVRKLAELLRIGRRGGYRDKFNGGFGTRSFAKDLLAVGGLRVG